MLLLRLEELKTSVQQAFEFGIANRGNEDRLRGAIDGLMIGDRVVDGSLVSSGVTLSFFTRVSAFSFTDLWAFIIPSAKACTSLFFDFDRACRAASISSCPAV